MQNRYNVKGFIVGEITTASKKQAPVFLNLLQMRFPVMAIVSIAHRISGVF